MRVKTWDDETQTGLAWDVRLMNGQGIGVGRIRVNLHLTEVKVGTGRAVGPQLSPASILLQFSKEFLILKGQI